MQSIRKNKQISDNEAKNFLLNKYNVQVHTLYK